jgi:hypothetical protein
VNKEGSNENEGTQRTARLEFFVREFFCVRDGIPTEDLAFKMGLLCGLCVFVCVWVCAWQGEWIIPYFVYLSGRA